MEWLAQNWIWVLFFAGFIAMHMFGHGGHGGHGGGNRSPKPGGKDGTQPAPEKSTGHHH